MKEKTRVAQYYQNAKTFPTKFVGSKSSK